MARKKLSEYKAKQLIYPELQLDFSGTHLDLNSSTKLQLSDDKRYVVKVDQGVKGRMNKGLVSINLASKDVLKEIERLKTLGYQYVYIDEFIPHNSDQEFFISLERERDGIKVYYSDKGGIHVEDNTKNIKSDHISRGVIKDVSSHLNISSTFIEKLVTVFESLYFSFLEINPLVVIDNKIHILDLAVEVDSAGEFFVKDAWNRNDFVQNKRKTSEEQEVEELAKKSQTQASFTLNVLNPEGSIFLLLSGGGASIVLADELYNLGFGKEIANYGEYSGNPATQETYIYAKNVLQLLLKSHSIKKTLIIGGGIANFTDIRKTFKGVIQAINDIKEELKEQNVKIYVRRGGPHEKEGLYEMKNFLEKEGLIGQVYGSEIILTDVIKKALEQTT